VQTRTKTTTENIAPGSVGDDPVVRLDTAAGFVYVVNRSDGNSVTQLDTQTLMTQNQLSTGSGTNPQDVAVIGTKWYVATFKGAGLEVNDISIGSGSGSGFHFINLGNPDPDGIPNCNSVIAVGANIFLSCELLNDANVNLPPRGLGIVKVIDSTTDTVTATVTLQHENPFGLLELLPDGNLGIGSIVFGGSGSGSAAAGAGCIEEVTTTAPFMSSGCITGLQNASLGAKGSFASRFAVTADGKTMMIAASLGLNGALLPYDFASSTLGSAISPSSQVIGDVTTCPDGNVAVSDSGTAAGLRLYSTTAEVSTFPVNLGIKPQSAHGLVCF
jgi:hypothetical protein